MSNVGHFDISGVFNVEQNYLFDMSNSYPSVNNAATVATYVHNLQDHMKELNTRFGEANTSGQAVLEQQNEMIQIINAEQTRLNEKKGLLNEAEIQNERIALLNDTYRKEYGQYTKILIVVIIGLVVHIILRLLSTLLPFGLLLVLHIINAVVCLIVILNIYAVLKSRSQINYDELVLPPPGGINGNNAGTDGSGNNPYNELCFDKSCCGAGTTWDPVTGLCIISNSTPSSSTPSSEGFVTNPLLPLLNSHNKNPVDSVLPMTPCESWTIL